MKAAWPLAQWSASPSGPERKVSRWVKPRFFVKKGFTWFDSKLELQVQHASPLNSKFKTDPIYILLLPLVFLLCKIRLSIGSRFHLEPQTWADRTLQLGRFPTIAGTVPQCIFHARCSMVFHVLCHDIEAPKLCATSWHVGNPGTLRCGKKNATCWCDSLCWIFKGYLAL